MIRHMARMLVWISLGLPLTSTVAGASGSALLLAGTASPSGGQQR